MKNFFTISIILLLLTSCHQLGSIKQTSNDAMVQAIKDQTDVMREHNKLIEEQNRILGDIAHKMK